VTHGLDIALARYNPDGSLDPTFGTGGIVISHSASFDSFSAVAVQPNGRIVAAGTSGDDFALLRYNPDGSPDPTFGVGGKVVTDLGSATVDSWSAMALLPDGKIVVAGRSGGDFALARYNHDGSLDSSFGSGGKLTTDFGGGDAAAAMALQPDGKIVLAGGSSFRVALARYNPNGGLDATFGMGGMVISDFGGGESAAAIGLQHDGKIVVAGGPRSATFVVARYNPDGRLDLPFGIGGMVATDFGGGTSQATALALQADGKIVVAGRSLLNHQWNTVLARYEGGSSTGAPFLRLDLNQSSFVPGEILRAGVVEANFGPAVLVDKYFGALLPPGTGPELGCPNDDAIIFLTTRMSLTCLSAPPQTFDPVARNLLLPAGLLPTTTPELFSGVWPLEASAGTYVFFTAFARAGTAHVVALSTQNVSLSRDAPQAPFALTATTPCLAVTLNWRDRNLLGDGFKIERRSGGGPFEEIETVGPQVTSLQDTGLTPGVVYTYRVRAFRGALHSQYSNAVVVTGAERPEAPTNLTVAAVSSGSILHWQDNSSNETAFTIEHHQFERGWVAIATVGPNVTSFKHGFDLGFHLLPVAFSYRLRAFNGFCPSNYSNVSFVRR